MIPIRLCGERADNFSGAVAGQETATTQIETFHVAVFT